MSEESDQEKTEQPSEKRLQDARDEGDIPRSRDLSGAMVVLAGVAALLSSSERILEHVRRLYGLGLHYSRVALFSDDLPARVLGQALREALLLFAPVAAATLVAVFAAPLLVGGIHFSGQALQPKLSRLDPVAGLGRVFSMRGMVELGKALLKLLLIGGALGALMVHWQGEMQSLGRGDVMANIMRAMSLLGKAGLWFAALLMVVGVVDAIYQKFDYQRRMRMTKQQIKDESKESEGNPELKSRVRQMQHQMSKRRMMEDLPQAHVVITNPTHFAVAIRYDEGRETAPRVIAKGRGELALRIRQGAQEHGVPTVESPPLARALYATTQLGREIPVPLYVAVAQILAYVYQLKRAAEQGQEAPPPPHPDVDAHLMGPYQFDEDA